MTSASLAAGWPQLGTSGAIVAFLFVDQTGAETPVVTITPGLVALAPSAPATPITLPAPIGQTGQLPYLAYPLPASLIGVAFRLVAPAGWVVTKAGPAPALDATMDPAACAGFLPPLDPASPSKLKIGWNVAGPSTTDSYYANAYWNGGFQATKALPPGGTFPAKRYLAWLGIANPVDPLGYVTCPLEGDWSVTWDGAWAANLTIDVEGTYGPGMGLKLVSEHQADDDRNHRRVYHVAGDPTRRHSPQVFLLIAAEGATNIRVQRPGLDPDFPPRFDPDLLAQIGPAACLRCMDVWRINFNGMTCASDLALSAIPHGAGRTLGGAVTQIDPAPNPPRTWAGALHPLYEGYTPVSLTFAAPHGCVPGSYLVTDAAAAKAGPNGNGTFPTADGQLAQLKAGAKLILLEIPDESHAVTYLGGAGTNTLAGTFPVQFGATLATPQLVMAPRDIIDLCNTCNTDCWLNVPLLLDDEGHAELAELFATALAPDHRVYLEYANEIWNAYGMAWNQTIQLGRLADPMISGVAWAAGRAVQVHAIWRNVFAAHGRAADLVRVLGSQHGNPGVTTAVCRAVQAVGGSFDALAVAPYLSNGPALAALGVLFDALSPDQLLDLMELYLVHGSLASLYGHHRQILNGFGFQHVQLVNYEGGVENPIGPSVLDVTPRARRTVALAVHPRMRRIVTAYLDQLARAGVTLHNYYTLKRFYYKQSSGSYSMWPAYTSFGQRAGPGDGSGGTHDNVADPFDQSQVASVIGQALLDWMTAGATP